MAREEVANYRGTANDLTLDLRVERQGKSALILSGDIYRSRRFVASLVCDRPQGKDAGTLEASGIIGGRVRFRGNPQLFTGEINLEIDERGFGSFRLVVDMEGGYRDMFTGSLEYLGSFLRRLTIEIDGVDGVRPPRGYSGRTGEMTIARAFQAAGFDVDVRIDPFSNFSQEGGRAGQSVIRGYSLGELHAAMEQVRSNAPPDRLHVHVFVCGFLDGRDGEGVLGVMYDFDSADLNKRPREGVAVFYSTLFDDPRRAEEEKQRDYVYTIVHEIGHALNLVHSFDKSRPSTLSWMNYPRLYPRGYEAAGNHNGTLDFWRSFPDCFDEEELCHLAHASPREIRAGGLPFGTYEDGATRSLGSREEGAATRLGANPIRAVFDVQLRVAPKKEAYFLGEPVFLDVVVTNLGRGEVEIPNALDPAEGFLRLTLRSPSGSVFSYKPPVRYCKMARRLRLKGGDAKPFEGLPLFLSANGATFSEPGDYQLNAELSGIDGYRMVASQVPATIRILPPQEDPLTAEFARALMDRPAVMQALYLRHPLVAKDEWRAVFDEREWRFQARRSGTRGPKAADYRINTSLSYARYIEGMGWLASFQPAPKAINALCDPRRSMQSFSKIDTAAMRYLPHSVAHRRNLVTRLSEALDSPGRSSAGASRMYIGDVGTTNQSGEGAARVGRRPVLEANFVERLRLEVPPPGLFGSVGLDRPQQGAELLSPFVRLPRPPAGKPRFLDIVSWCMPPLKSAGGGETAMPGDSRSAGGGKALSPAGKITRLADFVRRAECDLWALHHVDQSFLEQLLDSLNSHAGAQYECRPRATAGQKSRQPGSVLLFRTDSTRVTEVSSPVPPATAATRSGDATPRSKGAVAQCRFFNVAISQGEAAATELRCAVVASDAEGAVATPQQLTTWIRKDGLDHLILGCGQVPDIDRQAGNVRCVVPSDPVGTSAYAIWLAGSRPSHDHVITTVDSRLDVEQTPERLVVRSTDSVLANVVTHLFRSGSASGAVPVSTPVAARLVLADFVSL